MLRQAGGIARAMQGGDADQRGAGIAGFGAGGWRRRRGGVEGRQRGRRFARRQGTAGLGKGDRVAGADRVVRALGQGGARRREALRGLGVPLRIARRSELGLDQGAVAANVEPALFGQLQEARQRRGRGSVVERRRGQQSARRPGVGVALEVDAAQRGPLAIACVIGRAGLREAAQLPALALR